MKRLPYGNVKRAGAISLALVAVVGLSGCQTTGMNLHRSLNTKTYGYTHVPDPLGQKKADVERFEVRAGDCGSQSGWSDCKNDRERSELSDYNRDPNGSYRWYSWEFFVPMNYPNVYPTKVALGQWHSVKSSPNFMLQNSSGGLYLDNQVTSNYDNAYTRLISKEDLRGKWHRITAEAKWSKDNDVGYFNVWVNGIQKVSYKGRTMQKKAQGAYFKYGVYRSFLKRYKNSKNVDEVPTQIVYYVNVRKGGTRQEVEASTEVTSLQ